MRKSTIIKKIKSAGLNPEMKNNVVEKWINSECKVGLVNDLNAFEICTQCVSLYITDEYGQCDFEKMSAASAALTEVFSCRVIHAGYGGIKLMVNEFMPVHNPDVEGFADPMHY